MRDAGNIREVEQLGIDLMGFIFWSGSKRYVSQFPSYLPTNCKRVGVFVDEELEQVKRIAETYTLDYIQLHGNESPQYISQLGYPVIKALSVCYCEDITSYRKYEDIVDYFLFDTKSPSIGGSGKKFDWTVLEHYDGTTPFILSGGIGPEDVERVKAFHHPKCTGFDLNSRFEVVPGVKDIKKLKTFIQSL